MLHFYHGSHVKYSLRCQRASRFKKLLDASKGLLENVRVSFHSSSRSLTGMCELKTHDRT